METVYVFAIVDGFDYFLFGDVLGQRELYDEAVHVGIFVKFAYFGQQFVFGHIAFITDKGRFETAYFTGFYFCSYICFATSVVSYKDSGQVGTFTSISHNFCHFIGNFLLYLFGNGFSIYKGHVQ